MLNPSLPPLISILGPTASGKSSLALEIAQKFNGEIISCDSMQVYREMNIGSATPSQEELDSIPHHLVNILDISEGYDVQKFIELAEAKILDIHARGKLPILTGGTGMYARLLLYGFDLLPSDKELSLKIRQEFADNGTEALLEELKAIDPETAERVAANPRHLKRAVEVIRLTGEKVPFKTSWGEQVRYPGKQFILIPDPDYSRSRISKRTVEMLNEGWIEEAEHLMMNKGLLDSPTALQSLGYREIIQLIKGEFPGGKEALTEKLITLTCRYAKRQRTWFRNQHPGAEKFSYSNQIEFRAVADEIEQSIKGLDFK